MEHEKKGFFKETQQLAEEYIKERLSLLKLQTAEKAAKLVSFLFAAFIIGMLGFTILLLLSFLGGYFFSQLTGSLYYGFGIIILFYILLLALIVYLRKTLIYKLISDLSVRLFFEDTEITDATQ